MADAEPQIKPLSRFSTSTSIRMADTNRHIVPMPRWVSIIGIARLIIAILVLAFVAAAAGIWGGNYAAFGVSLFTASATFIIFAYYFVALSRKPIYYNSWAILGLEIFGVLFWLISFSLLANWTSVYDGSAWNNYGHTAYGIWNAPFSPESIGLRSGIRMLGKRGTNKPLTGVALAGTAAGLGAVEFVLFVVTLIIFSMSFHKHRLAGNPTMHPSMHMAAATAPAATVSDVTDAEKSAAPESIHTNGPATATAASTEAVEHEEEVGPQVVAKDSGSVV